MREILGRRMSGLVVLAVVGVALLGMAGAFHHRLHRLRRLIAAETASLDALPPPMIDGEVAVAGTVESLDEGDVVVEVALHERRDDASSPWGTETTRVEARPFLLRLASGRALRVEPGETPLLRDALDHTDPRGPDQRVRAARLTVGERVFVRGLLRTTPTAPFRDGRWDGVLGPSRNRLQLSTAGFGVELAEMVEEADAGRRIFAFMFALTQVVWFSFGGAGRPVYATILIDAMLIGGALLGFWQDGPWWSRHRARARRSRPTAPR